MLAGQFKTLSVKVVFTSLIKIGKEKIHPLG